MLDQKKRRSNSPEKEKGRGTPDVFSSSSCSSLSQNIPAKSVPLHEGTHTNTLTVSRQSPLLFKMRALQLLVLLLFGLVGAQQQALMDYLERRLLAIEVRT